MMVTPRRWYTCSSSAVREVGTQKVILSSENKQGTRLVSYPGLLSFGAVEKTAVFSTAAKKAARGGLGTRLGQGYSKPTGQESSRPYVHYGSLTADIVVKAAKWSITQLGIWSGVGHTYKATICSSRMSMLFGVSQERALQDCGRN